MAADRFSINKSWEHVQSKFVGTGHGDTTKFEWYIICIINFKILIICHYYRASNQHRDSIASHIGHHDMLSYFAVAQVILILFCY